MKDGRNGGIDSAAPKNRHAGEMLPQRGWIQPGLVADAAQVLDFPLAEVDQ